MEIGNVGVLDIREATLESIEDIEKIANVGMVIYSPNTRAFLTKLNILNMGTSIEVPDSYKFINGEMEITADLLSGALEPLSLLVNGELFIKSDVTVENFEQKIDKLVVNGEIFCPKSLLPILYAKLQEVNGEIVSYNENASIYRGSQTIDNSFLQVLNPKSHVIVMGKATINEDIDADLFDEKIDKLEILGKLVLANPKLLDSVNKKLENRERTAIEILQLDDFIKVEGDVTIDSLSIRKFNNSKVAFQDSVRFDEDVTEDVLKKHIQKIRTKGTIICKKELKSAILDLLEDINVNILTYSEKLIINQSEHRMTKEELKYLPKGLTIINHGLLHINEDIPPEMLLEKLEFLDNFGEILAGPEQYGVIMTRVRTQQGMIQSTEKQSGAEQGKKRIGNIGYLKL